MKKATKRNLIILVGVLITLLIEFIFYLLVNKYAPEAKFSWDLIGKVPLCNRKPERGIIINGFVLPLCARCSFNFLFVILGLVFFSFKKPNTFVRNLKFPVLILLLFFLFTPLVVDGVKVYFFNIPSDNIVRMITGGLFGLGLSLLGHKIILLL